MATIKEIQKQLEQVTGLDDPFFKALAHDERTGVKKLVVKRRKVIQDEYEEDARLEKMLCYEKDFYAQGIEWIAGIDEVGRLRQLFYLKTLK